MSKKQRKTCKHESGGYPLAIFTVEPTGDIFLYVICDFCGADFVQKGQLVS